MPGAWYHSSWHGLLAFVFYYPLFMSFLWMLGAVVYHLRMERKDRPPASEDLQPLSVLVPCYNEGPHVEETLRYALALDYPEFEVVAINDGSRDETGALLDRLAQEHPRLRVVHLARNQGKAMALHTGALLARNDLLLCIDGDALLEADCARWIARHFRDPEVAAVTGNPRIRNRSTLLGRVQVGEFSSIVGLIKRAQRVFGRLYTVSGVITAFRRSAVFQVGSWSPDALTEDIDITWKLQRAGWDVRFEPRALVWILMPETLRGLWKQRLRWAMGGAQVLLRNADVVFRPSQNHLWPLFLEQVVTLVWVYAFLATVVLWLLQGPLDLHLPFQRSPLMPAGASVLIGATCLLQFGVSKWLDSRYDKGLGRNYYWMIWYPAFFWMLTVGTAVVAFPKVLARGRGRRARWESPDRGVHLHVRGAP